MQEPARKMCNIAFEGCCHGELNKIYRAVEQLQHKIDLVIIGGDFQAVRNYSDLQSMSVPPKYARLGDFADYYSGKKKAPVLTIFIGGNHEASNYLSELFYGGWVAPNIYYMGAANVLTFKGLRIGGLSGIYNEKHYNMGHHERVPYNADTLRSVYHVRQFDVMRMYMTSTRFEFMLSHDWPRGIEHHGKLKKLLFKKPHFREDVEKGEIGSPPMMTLLKYIKPKYWWSSHLHVKYAAMVRHQTLKRKRKNRAQESEEDFAAEVPLADGYMRTHFLSLDKCVKGRNFIQLTRVPYESEQGLCYDPEWLAMTKALEPYMSWEREGSNKFTHREDRDKLIDEIRKQKRWVHDNIVMKGKLKIPQNFQISAPVVDHSQEKIWQRLPFPIEYKNNQTQEFCDLLQMENRVYKGPAKPQSRAKGVAKGVVSESAGNTAAEAPDEDELEESPAGLYSLDEEVVAESAGNAAAEAQDEAKPEVTPESAGDDMEQDK
ncbi:lariat debranching enzyme, C-terminal domain-containing protein [Myxozyma melibiosi]|uniref:Lariat debranching enzyme, C-terminal domain-containing protein n=1 Tax=Myxozyma melibiosi TaxID=54550 RepID=A0ABR1F4A1_9ASCO